MAHPDEYPMESYTADALMFTQEEEKKEPETKELNLVNPLFATRILIAWLFVIMIFFAVFGLFEGDFFGFGPSSSIVLFGVAIDTWWKWSGVMLFNFVDMLVFEWATEIITPWIMNEVQDKKTDRIDQTWMNILFIVNGYEICCFIRLVISIRMVFTQVDFMFAIILGTISAHYYTIRNYLKNKTVRKSTSSLAEREWVTLSV